MRPELDITGIVLMHADPKCLDRNLASMDFCKRLLVIDSGSDEETLAIARAHGAEIVPKIWEGAVPAYRLAFSRVTTRWAMNLDQDEYLTRELRDSIIEALADPGDVTGFQVPRKSFYLDRFVEHSGWRPDYTMRVYRMDRVSIHGVASHQEFHTDENTARLTGDIIHYPYRNFQDHLLRMDRYCQMTAEELHAKGRRAGLASALGHGVWRFFTHYVLRRGFLDGKAGLILAVHAFIYGFLKYLRLMELDIQAPARDGKPDWRGDCS